MGLLVVVRHLLRLDHIITANVVSCLTTVNQEQQHHVVLRISTRANINRCEAFPFVNIHTAYAFGF